MAVLETEIRKLRQEMREKHMELVRLITSRNLSGNWVKQKIACAIVDVSPRQMRNIRIHTDKHGKVVGAIRWRKGKGKAVEYWKPDLESYLNQTTVS